MKARRLYTKLITRSSSPDRCLHRVPFYLFLLVLMGFSQVGYAENSAVENLQEADLLVQKALQAADEGDLKAAKDSYDQFRSRWFKIEHTIKAQSGQAYSDIESNMGQVSYALLQQQSLAVQEALRDLQAVNSKFIQGQYGQGKAFQEEDIQLPEFIGLLQQTQTNLEQQDSAAALDSMVKVRESWLSVEGLVVSESATIYNDTERDMVVANAMILKGNDQEAKRVLEQMIVTLSPLANKSDYSLWDAAMIPIREGLEALLVVGALLAFTKKSQGGQGAGWVWSGVIAGLLSSAVLALLVKFFISSGAFGQNNFLIAGWTGIFAAAMLLYVSYWLHSKSNLKEWNHYIATKTTKALSTGSLVSLGFLSFLAVFREGTETVLFIIGMINQISLQDLLLGLLVGFGVLSVIAYLMLYLGLRMPLRGFFMVSSFIVFYLCIKFTGMGVHSLQLAGVVPSTVSLDLPSINSIGFYPSWQSSIPQILILVSAIAILVWKRIQAKN